MRRSISDIVKGDDGRPRPNFAVGQVFASLHCGLPEADTLYRVFELSDSLGAPRKSIQLRWGSFRPVRAKSHEPPKISSWDRWFGSNRFIDKVICGYGLSPPGMIGVGAIVKRVLITGARAPVALHIARILQAAGHFVWAADHLRNPLTSASNSLRGYHQIPSFRFDAKPAQLALNDLIDTLKIDIVIPTCEEVLYLAQLWQTSPPRATLFAPSLERLEQVHNKFRFIQLCEEIGLAAPETYLLQSHQDLRAFARHADRMVLKPVWSRFATEVLICPRLRQLKQVVPSQARPWIAQQFMEGDEISVYAVAHAGQLTALSAYQGFIRAGRGASVCFEPVRDGAVYRFVQKFVAETNWTGQVSFDLIRDKDRRLWPLECNPRATSGVHFFGRQSGFADALLYPNGRAFGEITAPQGVRLAMWFYGPSNLFSAGGADRFFRAVSQVQDVVKQPEDPVGLWPQARSVIEFSGIALRRRVSLQAASTFDIEWDGSDQSSIS